ncbi:MAG: hypothetical protein ACTSW7_00760 [Candidatus Thorarchaeota archaeon]
MSKIPQFDKHVRQMLDMVKSPEAKARIQELAPQIEEELSKLESYVPVEVQVAEILHEAFCNANHIDGCSWEYEKWEDAYHMHNENEMRVSKSMSAKAGYLRRAMAMLGKLRFGTFPRETTEKDITVFDLKIMSDRAIVELVKVVLGVEER